MDFHSSSWSSSSIASSPSGHSVWSLSESVPAVMDAGGVVNVSESSEPWLSISSSTAWCINAIDQFRYIKIQPKTIDLNTRLWGIKPHKLCIYSPEHRAEVYCFRLNFNIPKLVYSMINGSHFSRVGPLFQTGPIFISVFHFSKCDPFFQVSRSFPSVTVLFKCDLFFKVFCITTVTLIFVTTAPAQQSLLPPSRFPKVSNNGMYFGANQHNKINDKHLCGLSREHFVSTMIYR